jgi:hypothetical protein
MDTMIDHDAALVALGRELETAARAYIEHGKHPGSFILAIAENDAHAAAELCGGLHGPEHLAMIGHVAAFFLRHAPPKCFGNEHKVRAWMATGGAVGNGHRIAA